MKLKEFQQYMRKEKIDLCFFVYPENGAGTNLVYLAGNKPSFAFLAVTKIKATLFVSSLDHIPKTSTIDIKPLSKDWWKPYVSKTKKLGVAKTELTVDFFEQIKKKFKGTRMVDISSQLCSLREIKTSTEIAKIRSACVVTSNAFEALRIELTKRTLRTEQEVAFYLEKYFRSHKCHVAFPTIVAMDKNAATPHHVTGNTALSRGFLLLDFGAKFNNYCADMSRTLFLGVPTKKEIETYKCVQEAQQCAIDAVAAGVEYVELDTISRKKLGKKEKYFTHSLGHGIGLDVHEPPFYRPTLRVQKNHVFTIEPGVYLQGKYGIRIEDTLWFDGKKAHILTSATKQLICIKGY